jgi:hypothetical protein
MMPVNIRHDLDSVFKRGFYLPYYHMLVPKAQRKNCGRKLWPGFHQNFERTCVAKLLKGAEQIRSDHEFKAVRLSLIGPGFWNSTTPIQYHQAALFESSSHRCMVFDAAYCELG